MAGLAAPSQQSEQVYPGARILRDRVLNASGSIVESIRQVYVACPTLAPTSLVAGRVGSSYAATFTASDALGIATFGVAGALPTGLIWTSAGTLTGTPTQAGTFPLTVNATDASSGCAGLEGLHTHDHASPDDGTG